MVAVAIFAIVMTVAAGSLLAVIEADHKAQAQKSVMNNLNFALESMSRMVRVGTRYHCGTITAPGLLENPADCPGGGTLFAFEGAGGDDADAADQIVFRLRSGQMEQSTDGGTSYLPFTAPEVVIEDMDFYVTGSDPGDNEQPRVILTVRGYAGVRRARSEFNVETSITQRILDR
jgi:type II secretory pathway pseudopilin PulG